MGLTHIRYNHYNYISFVHLICPRCFKRAKAILITQTNDLYTPLIFSEFQYLELKNWKIACESCPFVKNIPFPKEFDKRAPGALPYSAPYSTLGSFFYKVEYLDFWAYNSDHLEAIIKYLENCLEQNNPYAFVISSYLRGDWKRNKKKLLTLIRKKFITNSKTFF